MTPLGSVTVTDISITLLPAAPLYALEIWSNAGDVAKRFEKTIGFALPKTGRSGGTDAIRLIRYEPTVWLVEGDDAALPAALQAILDGDGTLTAIGGGIQRVRLSGEGWRTLLMEGGIFDAESDLFAAGCSAATIIDHVAVRLHVISENTCDVYVPLSYSTGLAHFWKQALDGLRV
jgi:heterotetrameric sarcosine oxidase gamma subunit